MRKHLISILAGFGIGNIISLVDKLQNQFLLQDSLSSQVFIAGLCFLGIVVANLFME